MAVKISDVLVVILGGGQGSRLYPLTKERAKPAVPLAGKYRLIDIPISNCLNSGLEKIYVLTQFNSVSLHRHIFKTYQFGVFSTGWVQLLAAEQTPHSTDWYQGTADAVRKQLIEIRSSGARDVMILSGDHMYRMDYRSFVTRHRDTQADVTVGVYPVKRQDASRFGLLQADAGGRIRAFEEKPKDPEVIKSFATGSSPDHPCLASMGIYIFRTELLDEMLTTIQGTDFGNHILPAAIHHHRVFSHAFTDYWEDIGTIRSFYNANLALTRATPPFDFYDAVNPIYSHPRFLPTARLSGDCDLRDTLLADGCHIIDSQIIESVVGLRSMIGPEAKLIRSILMGADRYETIAEKAENRRLGRPDIGIGRGCVIEGAIIDKDARIGEGVVIRKIAGREDTEAENYVVRDGLVIVPKKAIIADGTVI